MTKCKPIAVIILIALVVSSLVGGSFAIFSQELDTNGDMTAKAFNTSYSYAKGINADIWAGETRYWYFNVENVDKNGKVSGVNIQPMVTVNVHQSGNKKNIFGLTVSIEEFVDNGTGIENSGWKTISSEVVMASVGSKSIKNSKTNTILMAGKHSGATLRIKYSLADTPEVRKNNGFYVYDNNNTILKVASVIDINVSFSQVG